MRTGGGCDEAGEGKPAALVVEYHPAASVELIEAGRFYEERSAGLGHKFLDTVTVALDGLLHNPMLGRLDSAGRRRWTVRRFPYVIIYCIDGALLRILALAHTSRSPDYWQPRDSAGR